MQYRVVILNKSMNPVFSAKFETCVQADFLVSAKRWLETFWRYRTKDMDASIRFIPAEPENSIDLFSEVHDIIF